tara:strand:+ start:400 stop:579 length:180 start_codon:yes stop_codon:yes gene_type:complete
MQWKAGMIVRKKNNLFRKFEVVEVKGDTVVLEDKLTGQVFPVTDMRTYEVKGEYDDTGL